VHPVFDRLFYLTSDFQDPTHLARFISIGTLRWQWDDPDVAERNRIAVILEQNRPRPADAVVNGFPGDTVQANIVVNNQTVQERSQIGRRIGLGTVRTGRTEN